MGLIERVGAGPTALDTQLFIYLIERHPAYRPSVLALFAYAESEGRVLVTSELALLEVLVLPDGRGNLHLAREYEGVLTRSDSLGLVPIERAQLRAAAELRARHRVTTPDALQLAAALAAGCATFVTNDRGIPAIAGLDVVQLRDVV